MTFTLPETGLVKVKSEKKDKFQAKFILEPLAPGYGLTLGHALRRVLLSSLAGAAITQVKIEDVSHEFTTLSGLKEDVIEIILNLKSLRIKLIDNGPAILKLNKKGPGEIKAADFAKNSLVEIIDPQHHIAQLDKKGKLVLEATVQGGRGYVPTEARDNEKLPLGAIAVDAIYTPIKKIHYEVENTRVGDRTDFDKLIMDITTDGSINPGDALEQAIAILLEHLSAIQTMIRKPQKTKTAEIETKKNKTTVVSKAKVKKPQIKKAMKDRIKKSK